MTAPSRGLRPWSVRPAHPLRDHLARALGLLPTTAQVLASRGYVDPASADEFLRAPLQALPRPREIPDLVEASRVVWRAVRGGRRVTVYGDFDTDGVCAVAILVRGLRSLGLDPDWYVPHRVREGYGLSAEAVRGLAERGTGCLVTVDCGVGALSEVKLAKELGLEVVVVDHHTPPPVLPPADALVDPKILHRPYAFRGYCAAGLCWLLVGAIRELAGAQPTWDLLELAAVATVADAVPLVEGNRVLVRWGLKRLADSPLPGLRALLAACGLGAEVTADDVAWKLAPRLAAAGRVEDAGDALRLLLTDDPQEAQRLSAELERHNAQRQKFLVAAVGQALAAVEEHRLAERPGVVVWGADWHPGVVGLVASRVRESLGRPAVALAVEGDRARGSARGVPGLDLVEALSDCSDLLERFGGHAQAAGLELRVGRLEEFRARFEEAVARRMPPDHLVPAVEVDAEVQLGDCTERLVDELGLLEPCGAGNPRPVLAVRGVRPLEVGCWDAGEHLWLRVWDGREVAEAVGFGLGGWGELVAFTLPPLDLAGYVERDRWQEGKVRWVLQDLRSPELRLDQVLADSAALLRRLVERAEDYLGGAYRGVEVRPAFFTKVVGVTFDGRQEVVAQLAPGEEVLLRRQPNNPHDPHAVQVVRRDGSVVGYLSSALAGRLAPHLDRGARYRATVTAVTGGGQRHLGVNLRVEQDGPEGRSAWVRAAVADSGPDLDKLGRLLWGGDRLPEPFQSAADRVLAGGKVCVACAPRADCSRLVLLVTSASALRGRSVVHISPVVELAEARWHAWKDALQRVGLRVARLHGLAGARELQEAEQATEAQAVDVVFTTPTYLSRRPELVAQAGLVALDGWATTSLPQGLADFAGPALWVVWDPKAEAPGWEVCGYPEARTTVRVVDRRAHPNHPWDGEGPAVVFAAGPRSAVELSRQLGKSGRVAYDHPGLPAAVRETVVRLFQQGRLDCLVCGGTAPEGLKGAQRLVWASPTAREVFLQQAGCGLDRGKASLVLAYGREEWLRARAEWESLHPSRQTLAAVWRLLRDRPGELRWPDPTLAQQVRDATGLDPSLVVPAALHVFEAAGLARRERVFGGWRAELLPAEDRKDLGSVLRFAEGECSRAAFEAGSRWMLHAAALEVLEQVASGSVAASVESGAG